MNTFLLPSLLTLWPWEYSPVVVVLDDERPEDHAWAWELTSRYAFMTVSYQAMPDNPATIFPGTFPSNSYVGYDRQQHDTFFADLHADAPVLALIDTDVVLTTFVTPDAVFSPGGLPADGGRRLQFTITQRHEWHQAVTAWAVGAPSPGDGMCFFPVFVWRDSLLRFRRHVAARHADPAGGAAGASFQHFFEALSRYDYKGSPLEGTGLPKGVYSQFTMLAGYLWHFERERYDFRVEGWASRAAPGDAPDPPDAGVPRLHLGTHMGNSYNHAAERQRRAACYAGAFGARACEALAGEGVNLDMAMFALQRGPGCMWCDPFSTDALPAAEVQRRHHAAAWPVATQRLRPDRDCVVLPTQDWNATAPPRRCRFTPPPTKPVP
jgi:hypothetical protein